MIRTGGALVRQGASLVKGLDGRSERVASSNYL